jgi:hypothetical protein
MLPIEETTFEFDNFAYELLPGGKLKYSAPDGYNDDIVMAHALAVSSLQPIIKINKVQPTIVRQEYVKAVRSLQRDENSEYEGI